MKIRIKKLRYLLIIIVIIIGITQFVFISYPFESKLKKITIPLSFKDKYDFFPSAIIIFNPNPWAVSGSGSGSHPENSKHEAAVCEKILNLIDNPNENKKKITVTIIPDDTMLWHLQYLAYIRNRHLNIICDWSYTMALSNKVSFKDLILESDYVVDKEGGWQGEPYAQYAVNTVRSVFNFHKKGFSLLEKLKWSDESHILIYKKNPTK